MIKRCKLYTKLLIIYRGCRVLVLAPVRFIYWEFLKRKIRLKKDEWGFVCPFGLGDTYFICSLAKSFLNLNGGKIVLAVSESQKEIPNMFQNSISRVLIFKKLDRRMMKRFGNLEKGRLCVGHPSFFYKGQLLKLLGYKNFKLIDLYRFILNLPDSCELDVPARSEKGEANAKKIFNDKNLAFRKTVFLAPMANSIDMVDASFWSELALKLKEEGFLICCNDSNYNNKVTNATPVDVSLDSIVSFIEMCGFAVSIRSGLCDLLSHSKCCLSIVYPNQKWYGGTVLSGCSLKEENSNLCFNEYVVSEKTCRDNVIRELIDKIKDFKDESQCV